MTYTVDPSKPLPSTEYSLKSVSWHLKEISQSLKDLGTVLRATDIKLGAIAASVTRPNVPQQNQTQQGQRAQQSPPQSQYSDGIPF